jgi:RHS repeat-associated protein
LQSSTVNGSKTTFLYDGDELVAEYNASGTLLRRYVQGVGSDDPLVWFEGTGTTSPKYLLADERGSIVSETNASGSVVQTHQYGPYGELINQSTSRFRYTGQILIPGTELYHYKARVYHPKLGRFLQTDPIGYKDGMNWYAYVGNDPMNKVDPDGQVAKRILTEAQRLIRNAKAKGRREALKEERKELQETGESRSQLTPERQKELLDTGKLKNMDGHHVAVCQ